ncbi:tRNA (adenosine(37)-N6)-dimethylallyltransferase MiaA [Thalassotalea aquiviva]|uniref:tRNA (adenosine(37)-N6)-dimethylallyltransferase MiaA n=1 Tax=Thalassotalea aquiviva TaxID=3242415 RepID=UPI00352B6CA5
MSQFNLLAILGATASGKTRLAVDLAKQLNGEVISADSRQVYKGLDIGSGKDLEEYGTIPYHLIDIVEPGYEYNIFDFQGDFIKAFEDITERNKFPILAGGSALYVDAVLKDYRLVEVPTNPKLRAELEDKTQPQLADILLSLKPNQHNTTDLLERERIIRAIEIAKGELDSSNPSHQMPNITPLIMAIKWSREQSRERITYRLKQRFEQGLIDEVETLHKQGVSWDTLYFYGLEYRFIGQYLQGLINKNDCFQKLNSAIHQFAKKQDTWLRRLERQGQQVHWLDGQQPLLAQAMQVIANQNSSTT